MKTHLLMFLIASILTSSCGIQKRRLNAYEAIENLKNGVLLVQLITYKNTIKELEERGDTDKADEYRAREREENLLLMSYFTEHLDFCPVYFYHPDELKKIKEGQLKKVFRDKNIEIDPDIDLAGTPYLIAQFGYPEVSEPYAGIKDIVILDPEFNQLESPFPYRARNINFYLVKKVENPLNLQTLNYKLQKFYYKSVKKQIAEEAKNIE